MSQRISLRMKPIQSNFKQDLQEWLKGRFASLIREQAKYLPINVISLLYAQLIKFGQDEEVKFNNALFYIFGVSNEISSIMFKKLQTFKINFKELEKTPDQFYNSQQYQEELKFIRNDNVKVRLPQQLDTILTQLSQSIKISSDSPQSQIFKHSRSKYFQNPCIIEVKCENGNELIEIALKQGQVQGFLQLKGQHLIQMACFESCLAICHFGEIKCNYLFLKQTTETDAEKKDETVFVELTELSANLLCDNIMNEKFMHQQFIKAIFFKVEDAKALIQFVKMGCAVKFLSMKEYEGVCKAQLVKDVNMDDWLQCQIQRE